METKPRTTLSPKILAARRHVHSFVQSSLTPLNQDDFGSNKHEDVMWCDLQLNKCPSLFMNSINPKGDKRKHNVAFEVEVCHPGPDKLVITAERDIHPGEELLSNYLEEEEEEEEKEEENKE